MKTLFIKLPDGQLAPLDEPARKVVSRAEVGEPLILESFRGRSAKNHRRFFAFVNLTFDMQDTYTDIEVWRKVLEMHAGHFDTVVDLQGETHFWPRSIAWDKIKDEDEFQQLFNRVVNGFIQKYGHDISREELLRAIEF